MDVRTDVESLFLIDEVPNVIDDPMYDVPYGGRIRIRLSTECSILYELRAQVVMAILDIASRSAELAPFTIVKAHEVMACHDISLHSLLVHPEFTPLLVRAQRQWFGMKLKIFAHEEVPRGEVYGLAEPMFLGVVAVSREGLTGLAVTNPWGVLRGSFRFIGSSC